MNETRSVRKKTAISCFFLSHKKSIISSYVKLNSNIKYFHGHVICRANYLFRLIQGMFEWFGHSNCRRQFADIPTISRQQVFIS